MACANRIIEYTCGLLHSNTAMFNPDTPAGVIAPLDHGAQVRRDHAEVQAGNHDFVGVAERRVDRERQQPRQSAHVPATIHERAVRDDVHRVEMTVLPDQQMDHLGKSG